MPKKTIFIGSSREAIDVAKTIAQALSDKGYTPLRWWNAIPAGNVLIDKLIEHAK